MTQVKIKRVPVQVPGRADLQDELQLLVDGHAGYDRSGRDLVCAAESMLVQAYAAFLSCTQDDELYDFSVDSLEGKGNVEVSAIPTQQGWDYVRGAFECTAMGFCLLAINHPQNVTVCVNPQNEEE